MARNKKYNDKEYDLLQRLKHENEKLKKQNKRLKKQLQRIDIDRYENLKDIIYKHYQEDAEEQLKKEKKKNEKDVGVSRMSCRLPKTIYNFQKRWYVLL